MAHYQHMCPCVQSTPAVLPPALLHNFRLLEERAFVHFCNFQEPRACMKLVMQSLLVGKAAAAAQHFSASWFTASMGTGAVSLVVANFPYRLPAKLDIGWAIWWLNLLLFCLFTVLLSARFLLSFSDCEEVLAHPVKPLYLAAVPMALATIVPLFLLPRWGSHVATAAVALWGVDAALAGACSLLLPLHLFIRHQHSLPTISGTWLLPAIPSVVASASGGIVARACTLSTARHVVVGSCILWGLGLPLSVLIITAFFLRLALCPLEPRELTVSISLPVGPLSMAAVALLQFHAVGQHAAATAVATPADAGVGPGPAPGPILEAGLESLTVAAALVLWAAALWWLVAALVMIGSNIRSLAFNMGWWGMVFPLGVFSLAAEQLGSSQILDSEAFRVVGAGLAGATVVVWASVAGRTIYHLLTGTLSEPPSLL